MLLEQTLECTQRSFKAWKLFLVSVELMRVKKTDFFAEFLYILWALYKQTHCWMLSSFYYFRDLIFDLLMRNSERRI